MAQPLLDFLTGTARAALPFMRKAAAAGVTGAAALDVLRAFGVHLQTQRFYDVYNALLGIAKLPAYLRITPPTEPLPYEAHALAVYTIPKTYSYLIRVINPITDTPHYATISSDVPLSLNNIKAHADALRTSDTPTGKEFANLPSSDAELIEAKTSLEA